LTVFIMNPVMCRKGYDVKVGIRTRFKTIYLSKWPPSSKNMVAQQSQKVRLLNMCVCVLILWQNIRLRSEHISSNGNTILKELQSYNKD